MGNIIAAALEFFARPSAWPTVRGPIATSCWLCFDGTAASEPSRKRVIGWLLQGTAAKQFGFVDGFAGLIGAIPADLPRECPVMA